MRLTQRARPDIIHVIDELKVGGAQTHLVTMLRQAQRTGTFDHRVVSLFGDGPIGDQVRELGIPVDVLDLRGYFQRRRFDRAYGELLALFRQHHPAIAEAHLTWAVCWPAGGLGAPACQCGSGSSTATSISDPEVPPGLLRVPDRDRPHHRLQPGAGRLEPSHPSICARPHGRVPPLCRYRMLQSGRSRGGIIVLCAPTCRTLFCAVGTLGAA